MGYQKLVIDATTQDLPAPYAFTCKIVLVIEGVIPSVDFSIVYNDREDLSPEEIYDEGFTGDDDFSWKGSIGSQWLPVIEEVLQKTTLRKTKTPVLGNTLHVLIDAVHTMEGVGKNGVPSEYEMWEFFVQELMQAVYEAGKKEKPLEIYIKKIAEGKTSQVVIKGSFEKREASLAINNDVPESLNWQELKNHMKLLFQADYLPELASTKPPKRNGIYISMDEKEWYEMGVGLLEPSKKSKSLVRIKEWLDQVLG